MEELRQINPQYLHDIIPGTEKTYILRLPHNYTMQFVNNEESIYSYKDTLFFSDVAIKKVKERGVSEGSMTTHTVRSGETLGGIARKYRTTVSNIKRWNNLRSDMIRCWPETPHRRQRCILQIEFVNEGLRQHYRNSY